MKPSAQVISSPDFSAKEHKINYSNEWISLVYFQLVDAAKHLKSYVDCGARDITHIYSYNKVMSRKDTEGIC
jgi:hypothetical protein